MELLLLGLLLGSFLTLAGGAAVYMRPKSAANPPGQASQEPEDEERRREREALTRDLNKLLSYQTGGRRRE